MKDNTNKKALGKMKDELQALPMIEFISRSRKVYSYICKTGVDDDIVEKNVKKLKGVSKAVVKNQITHQDFNAVLHSGKSIKRDIVAIRSLKHQLYTIKQSKVALTAYYDKFAMLDNIHCVPFGFKGTVGNDLKAL